MLCWRNKIVKQWVSKSCDRCVSSISVHFFISSLCFCFFYPFSLFPYVCMICLTVRRMLWPLWPLTPSLSMYHLGAGQEVGVKKRARVRPNRSASTSPTSLFASETQIFVRCSGYDHIPSSLPPKRHIPTPYCHFKSLLCFCLVERNNILTFAAIWKDSWRGNHLQWAGVKGQSTAFLSAQYWKSDDELIVWPCSNVGLWICHLWECSWGWQSTRKAERDNRRRQKDRGDGPFHTSTIYIATSHDSIFSYSCSQVNNATARVVTKKPQTPLVNADIAGKNKTCRRNLPWKLFFNF